jgi:hypothetical protein
VTHFCRPTPVPSTLRGSEAAVFRPSAARLLTALWINAAASAVLLFFVAAQLYRVRNSPEGQLITGAVLVGVILFAFVWQWLYVANARITVDTATLKYTNRWGSQKTFSLADVGGLTMRSLQQLGPSRPIQYVIVYGKDHHRALFRLSRAYWSDSDLLDLGRRLGGRQEEVSTTGSRLDSEFPGSRAFWERHAIWIVVLAALAVVVGIIALTPPTR